MLRIPHCLDSQLTDGGKVVSPTHQPHFTPQKHYYFTVCSIIFMPTELLEHVACVQQATAIAINMVKDWGMSEKVGLRTHDGNSSGLVVVNELSPGTNDQIDSEIKRILTVSFLHCACTVSLYCSYFGKRVMRSHCCPCVSVSSPPLPQFFFFVVDIITEESR
jgi:hypothetical protein